MAMKTNYDNKKFGKKAYLKGTAYFHVQKAIWDIGDEIEDDIPKKYRNMKTVLIKIISRYEGDGNDYLIQFPNKEKLLIRYYWITKNKNEDVN